MKTLCIAATLAATTTLVPAAHAKESIVVLSPFATSETKEVQIREIGRYLAETTEPGETSIVLNGWDAGTIARFEVPNDPDRFARVPSRMRANVTFFKEMKSFAEATPPSAENPHEGQVDWPGVIRRVGRDFATETSRDLIFYDASPIYHDARSPGFSMRDGVLFTDAHHGSSRDVSPFGAEGQSAYLKNYIVHWGMPDEAWMVSDRHGYHAERTMTLAIKTRSGVLATFDVGGATALENAKRGVARPLGDYALESDGRLAMISFQPQAEAPTTSIYDRQVSDRAPATSELFSATNVEIAIRWDCSCDFDLAVKPQGGETISFRSPSTTDGQLYKDFTSSAGLNNGWETIALPGPVDLTEAVIAANLFSGQGGEGELRIAISGETWAVPFSVAGPGNGGTGLAEIMSTGRSTRSAWTVFAADTVTGAGG